MKLKTLAVATASALALYGQALSVHAESTSAAGGAGGNTTARLDFRVDIPSFLRLRVGSTGGTINQIQLSPTVAQLATSPSTAVSATAGSGDVGNGTVNVAVQGNPGGSATNLTYTTGAASLSDGTNTVPWSTVKVATAGTDSARLTHPAALADGFSGAAVSVVAGITQVSGVINYTATWTYTFNDGGTVYPASAAGGYTGRVTYKLVTP